MIRGIDFSCPFDYTKFEHKIFLRITYIGVVPVSTGILQSGKPSADCGCIKTQKT